MPVLSNDEMPAQPPRKPSRRGGRRPGAGAPKGNLNALKHGANSHQIQQLAVALALVPDARKALARLVRRQRLQQSHARDDRIVAPVHCGLETGDVIALTDARAGLSAAKRRVLTIEINYHRGPHKARYDHTLRLGAP